ncbi:sugar phosphate isomerase/epimerase family protein [Rhizobium rhizogenes]|uniref:sugar phosphate isomerase/epimerase family protein n=1 Tax=Rhizobium rhizogenes TaxID=359 RepID=UPI0022C33D45|nr:sugar phosphate isomerase/epimerase family protein [Rhizobium rhizogenes]MCZ7489102.1 sugar phosphate isomerase/epimerase [Rhizobium rhizogenes]
MAMKSASISNIAWPAEMDEEALSIAVTLGFSGVEIAPAKVFGPIDLFDKNIVVSYREKLLRLGLSVSALQGVLFGLDGAHLFRTDEARDLLFRRLKKIATIAAILGTNAVVFGAPTVRDPGTLSSEEAWELAVNFFRQVGSLYNEKGIKLCFEANPAAYNCKFITTTDEAIRFVSDVNQEGLSLQIDTGTIFMNGEDLAVVAKALSTGAHFHISEPHLNVVGMSGADHSTIGKLASQSRYTGWKSVEMRRVENWREAMASAASVFQRFYL